MSKTPRKGRNWSIVKRGAAATPPADFDEVPGSIVTEWTHALAAVNTELIDPYWKIREHISRKFSAEGCGKSIVESANPIHKRLPNVRGFSASNLWRMMQLFETYRNQQKLATPLRELPWSHNLAIISRRKRDEELEFNLQMALQECWSERDLEPQSNGAVFERVVLLPAKISPMVRQLHRDASSLLAS